MCFLLPVIWCHYNCVYMRSMVSCLSLTSKGFASLEAKRKYKVPRDIPKHQSQMRETSSPVGHVTKEVAACKSNCTSGSLLDSGYQGMASPIENCVSYQKLELFTFLLVLVGT